MHCNYCGEKLPKKAEICPKCGKTQGIQLDSQKVGNKGFSVRIEDPAFEKYAKKSNLTAGIVVVAVAIGLVAVPYAYNAIRGREQDPITTAALLLSSLIVLTVGAVMIIKRLTSSTWDGTVVKKKVKRERIQGGVGHTVYIIVIEKENGRKYKYKIINNSNQYDYFQVGDKVRHHKGLNTLEKYDKTKDEYIPCAACSSMNHMSAEYCSVCGCPLLK